MSARKTPVLLRESPLTKRVLALTRYRRKTVNGNEVIEASTDGKHDVTADFDALVLGFLLDAHEDQQGCPDIVEQLDGAARGMKLTDGERCEIERFRERLILLIDRHNSTGHGTRG